MWWTKIVELASKPENIMKAAKLCTQAIQSIKQNNEQLKKFESDAAIMRKENDELEAMVQANWQGIKKCNSEVEYLQEEERIAQALEMELLKSQQQKRIGS